MGYLHTFHNNTNGIVAGNRDCGINLNIGVSLRSPIYNLYIYGNKFVTDNSYYYYESIMTKNSTDIFLENTANYQIIKNTFNKEYGDPDKFHPTDQVCSGIGGRAYLGNIYLYNTFFANAHGTSNPMLTNIIYKNFFKNRPWVRCTNNFSSVVFMGKNENTGNGFSDIEFECNWFDNDHPPRHIDGSVADVAFRPDENKNDECYFNGNTFGNAGSPAHNRFSKQNICGTSINSDGYDFLYYPPLATGTGQPWKALPGKVNYWFNSDPFYMSLHGHPDCILNGPGNHQNNATTLTSGTICYPNLYNNKCSYYSRSSEVQPAHLNPKKETTDVFFHDGSVDFPFNTVSSTGFGVSAYPTVTTNGQITVRYIFPADEYYLLLFIFDAEGNPIGNIILNSENFDSNGNLILNLGSFLNRPGTYYLTFRNNKGQYQTITIIIP